MKQGYVYMMTNNNNTALYTGVTSDLKKRVYEHKNGLIEGFTSKYRCHKLVYWEVGGDIRACIEREKQIKAGSRKKKNALVDSINPKWLDLSEHLKV